MGQPTVIPFFGVKRQYANLRDELLHVTDQVYSSGQVLDGKNTQAFERTMAAMCNRDFAIAVNSCTQGIIMALQTLQTAGKVLIPDVSFAATLNSVLMTEHEPALCDVDINGLLDLETSDYNLANVSVNAIMYVNLFGHTIDYDRFRVLTEFFGEKPFIIEDAAQSFGAKYKGIPSGKMGDVSVLSFDPTKNLPNYGSGGMVLTDNYEVADYVRSFRDNGKDSQHALPGTNSKMSEADCAQMLVKLQHFDEWQERRNAIATYYTQQLSSYVDIVLPGEDVESAWHKFVLRPESRASLKHHLAMKGVDTRIHYEQALHDLPVAMNAFAASGNFLNAVNFCKQSLSLPIYPELTDTEVEHIAQSVKEFYW